MLTAGLDEVGWGSLAGPIISVVFVTDSTKNTPLPSGVNDSKQLSEAKRYALFKPLVFAAYDVGLGYATAREVDTLKPMNALQLSYQRALEDLHCVPDLLIMDGTNKVQSWRGKQIVEPKADAKYIQVSAASIVAKVFRDELMAEYAQKFPFYGWEHNSGYYNVDHTEGILKYGLLLDPADESRYLHRKSYCKRFL
jgi:ribonuclease HII